MFYTAKLQYLSDYLGSLTHVRFLTRSAGEIRNAGDSHE